MTAVSFPGAGEAGNRSPIVTAVIDTPRFRRPAAPVGGGATGWGDRSAALIGRRATGSGGHPAGPEVVIDLSSARPAAPTPTGRRRRDAAALLVAALAAFLAGATGYVAVRPDVERAPAFFAAPHETRTPGGEATTPSGASWAGPGRRPMPVADPVRTRRSPDWPGRLDPQSPRR